MEGRWREGREERERREGREEYRNITDMVPYKLSSASPYKNIT